MRRKLSSESDPADWFYLASDRLKTADLVWKAEGLTASGIELLQEAVERLFKGYLIAKGWKLVKTHDLSALVSEAISIDAQFQAFTSLADELTRDFFAQHYPELRRHTDELVALIKHSLPRYSSELPRN